MSPGVLADGRMLQGGGWQLRRISFVAARHPDAHSISPENLGLVPLNESVEPSEGVMRRPLRKPLSTPSKYHAVELFAEADIAMHWATVRKTGAGLQNLGNTCFMNSVLQCLIHTPPLAELFLSSRSLSMGVSSGFDPLANTRELTQRSLQQRSAIVSPVAHAKNLRRISRSFRLGRQEDAHEYLIALLDSIHVSSLAGLKPKPAPEVEQTSFIYRIFAGKIRSQVKCTHCGFESNTYDPFLDLSLEITRAGSVQRALERFTAGEVLDGANKYKCSKEKKPVRAIKRMTVHAAPNVLVLQLKRFEFSMSGHKISKKVDFEPTLDLSPYMSKPPAVPALYDLYAVLVHSGHSLHSGHYYSFVRSGTGMWHVCDDTNVSQVSERIVLGQKAYILFYIKRTSHPSHRLPVSPPSPVIPTTKPAPIEKVEEQRHSQQQQRHGHCATESVKAAAGAAQAASTSAAAGNKPLQENGQFMQQQGHKFHLQTSTFGKRKLQSRGTQFADARSDRAGKQMRSWESVAAAAAEQGSPAESPVSGPLSSPPPVEEDCAMDSPNFSNSSAQLRSPLPARFRLLTRSKMGNTPNKMLRAGSSRRGKRLAELSSLHHTLNLARQRNRLLQQHTIWQDGQQQEVLHLKGETPTSGSGIALPKVTVGDVQKGKRQKSRGGALQGLPSSVAREGGDTVPAYRNGVVNSSASAIAAPEWPPITDGASDKQSTQRQAAADGRVARSGAEVKKFLHQAAGGHLGLAVEQWEDVGVDVKRRHDRLLVKAAPRRKQIDDYDMEYDTGRVKKNRNHGTDGRTGHLDGATFDAAWQNKRRGRGERQGLNPVQLSGNTLKRQQQRRNSLQNR